MLFTGQNEATATALADYLFVQSSLTTADLAGPVATFQSLAAQVTPFHHVYTTHPCVLLFFHSFS